MNAVFLWRICLLDVVQDEVSPIWKNGSRARRSVFDRALSCFAADRPVDEGDPRSG